MEGGNFAGRDLVIQQAASTAEERQQQRNRENLLKLVWNTWIEGVLHQSLYQEMRIELGMETRPEAVEHPWEMVTQLLDQERKPVPPGTTMLELFDRYNGALLILGEPGSGKTTMLLELARLAIERAQRDPSQQIPVIFNLSSWTAKRPFGEWLVSELKKKYDVPLKVGRGLVERDELMLLLDGLDEVKENREECLKAINDFRKDHNVPLAVCSRSGEYQALSTRSNLRGAVLILPLSDRETNRYLEKYSPGLVPLYHSLGENAAQLEPKAQEAEWQFLHSPLCMSLLVLTFRQATEEEKRIFVNAGDYRKILFDQYIERMFKEKGKDRYFHMENTKPWLQWIARSMIAHGQSLFSIEDLQPSWLPYSEKRAGLIFGLIFGLSIVLTIVLSYELSIVQGSGDPNDYLIFGLTFVLIFGLVVGRSGGRIVGLVGSLSGGRRGGLAGALIGGLVGALMGGLIFYLSFGLVDGLISVLTGALMGGLIGVLMGGLIGGWSGVVIFGLVGGLIFGLFVGMIFYLIFGTKGVLIGVLIGGLIGVLIGVLIGRRSSGRSGELDSTPTDQLIWSWVGFRSGLKTTLIFGLILGLIFGLSFILIRIGRFIGLYSRGELMDMLVEVLIFVLIFGLIFGLIGGLIGGLESVTITERRSPDGGIKFSRLSSLLAFMIGVLIVGLIVGPIFWLVGGMMDDGLMDGLIFGLKGGLIFGLVLGLNYGGEYLIKHYITRWLLYRAGSIPWDLVAFLDFCTGRIFLRRVGGSYIFIHRMLMEHFAEMDQETPAGRKRTPGSSAAAA